MLDFFQSVEDVLQIRFGNPRFFGRHSFLFSVYVTCDFCELRFNFSDVVVQLRIFLLFAQESVCSACGGSGDCPTCGGVGEIEIGGESG